MTENEYKTLVARANSGGLLIGSERRKLMPIQIKWNGQLVGRIVDGELTEGTKAFQKIWVEFREKGLPRLGPAQGPVPARVLADGVIRVFALHPFLDDVERAGYEVTGKDGDVNRNRGKHEPQPGN